ncbi:MAG TPA: hypothetical protein VNH11_02245 [Pirellulales bacterium]|nr:hypothetical protein [Pirellulales bacterium]
MRVVVLSLAIALGGLAVESYGQCPAPARVYYGGQAGYAGYAPYGAYYAPYGTYAPFTARQPNYPVSSSSAPAARYGMQNSYFRGSAGPFAPPGGTFFGGYDYRVTYPPGWYGGYWTWW